MALRLIIGSFPLPDDDVVSNDGGILGHIDASELDALFHDGVLAQDGAHDVRPVLHDGSRQQHGILDERIEWRAVP